MKNIPPVTRYLLIANIVCFVFQRYILPLIGIDLTDLCGLHFLLASDFHIFQLVTYMFLHGNLMHLFFNMFSLWMFGPIIERTLGTNRFLLFWFVCGIGAGLCQELWQGADYVINEMYRYDSVNLGTSIIPMSTFLNLQTTIGASGACYGVLLAFGWLYPNERLMLLFPPIPMKAKYFVAGYAVLEVYMAYRSNDNVAHFAHLGGMLFGWLLLLYWKHRTQRTSPYGAWGQPYQSRQRQSFADRLKTGFGLFGKRRGTTAGNAHRTATRETDYDYNMRTKEQEDRMDEILAKVSRSGYDSLTKEEKQELFQISRRGKRE